MLAGHAMLRSNNCTQIIRFFQIIPTGRSEGGRMPLGGLRVAAGQSQPERHLALRLMQPAPGLLGGHPAQGQRVLLALIVGDTPEEIPPVQARVFTAPFEGSAGARQFPLASAAACPACRVEKADAIKHHRVIRMALQHLPCLKRTDIFMCAFLGNI
ncbi:hypothetical protein AXA74_23005 [Bordetella hinzii LMG 13501]|nr:hypothetical protein AXA74_23005 [Bordetella hinzii LMG 13501]